MDDGPAEPIKIQPPFVSSEVETHKRSAWSVDRARDERISGAVIMGNRS
jgi:hypothetical protein